MLCRPSVLRVVVATVKANSVNDREITARAEIFSVFVLL
jgi:hypothetical protein